jgi:DNA ligase (NAD+)
MAVVNRAENASEALAGKTIVISGNFTVSRDEMKALIEANGGKNSGSVSGKTSFLLAGSKPGPEKIKKAESLGIPILDEEAFRRLLPGGESGSTQNEEPELTLF